MVKVQPILPVCLILSLAVLISCDEERDNYIDGSLVKNYNISYKSVKATLYEEYLSIEYKNSKDVAVLQITLRTSEIELAKGKTYPLEEYGSVTRTDGDLPDLESGELTLNEFSDKEGALVSGEFNAKFKEDNEGSQTLRGAFKTKLIVSEI